MALSGVRSSWLILARNCDLCWLATSSCRLLSWISSKSRTFSIAITAWSAKVVTSSICFASNGFTTFLLRRMTPIGFPSRKSGTPRCVRKPPNFGTLYRDSTQQNDDAKQRAWEIQLARRLHHGEKAEQCKNDTQRL